MIDLDEASRVYAAANYTLTDASGDTKYFTSDDGAFWNYARSNWQDMLAELREMRDAREAAFYLRDVYMPQNNEQLWKRWPFGTKEDILAKYPWLNEPVASETK